MSRATLMTSCLLAYIAAAHAYTGMGTAYSGAYDKDATGFNSCQFGKLDDRWERFYGALPTSSFDRSKDCGRCVRVRGTESDAPTNAWYKVMIVDSCASCNGRGEENDIDFSTDALKAITGYSWDRKGIEWEWTSCDGDDAETQEAQEEDKAAEEDSADADRRRLRKLLRG
ncbi:hypothetical protein D9Q98_001895 [Chlorella vulgaris]|uniref:Uncharacterized protein n=1 Tax=Chlorella vulgaris TaxID=3077 RepID=A0A9D4TVH6_CHLVU|nr:hypothetical protein D9Q98_001895 [Chlorella vulgaris]